MRVNPIVPWWSSGLDGRALFVAGTLSSRLQRSTPQVRLHLSHSKSDISDFDNLICPTRVNPSWVGEVGLPPRCEHRPVQSG
jgi:hypothetical protein